MGFQITTELFTIALEFKVDWPTALTIVTVIAIALRSISDAIVSTSPKAWWHALDNRLSILEDWKERADKDSK